MARYRRKRYGRRRTYRKRMPKYRKRTGIKRLIKRVLYRNVETKKNQITLNNIVVQQAITDVQVQNLLPDVLQGTGQANRVGNRIKPTSLTMKMSLLCFNQANPVSPTYFDIYIFKFKGSNQYSGGPTNVDMSLFLQNDNSSTPYVGATLNGLRPLNSDLFQLVKRKRVLLSNLTAGNLGVQASINPNKTLSFNLTKACKKLWIYDDNSSLLSNDNLYIAVGSTQADGTALGSAVGGYSVCVDLKYKDA